MKKMSSVVCTAKVKSVSDGVAPELVEGATLKTNVTTSRGQSPQKGRKPMIKKVKKAKRVTVGPVPNTGFEIWYKGSKKILVSFTSLPVNGCGVESMWIAVAVWREDDTEEGEGWDTESAIAQDYAARDIACNAYDALVDKLYRFHGLTKTQEG